MPREKPPEKVCTPDTQESCPQGEACWPTEDGRGKCLPDNSCTLDDGKECKPNEICWPTQHTPPGLGTCLPDNSCTLDEGKECKPGHVCQDTPHAPPGVGTCETEEVSPTPVLVRWGLWQWGEELIPLSEEGEVENAGWAGPGPAQLKVVTEGPGSNEGLQVWAGALTADCQEAQQVKTLERYLWSCAFDEGFANEGPTVVVHVQLGNHAPQSKTYPVETQAPEVVVSWKGSGLLGSTVTVCAEAKNRQGAPTHEVLLGDIDLDTDETTLVWEEDEENTATRKCKNARLPENIRTPASLNVRVDVTATDVARNTSTTHATGSWTLTRIAAHKSTGVFGAVMPLAWTNEHVVVGTSDQTHGRVYFYDSQTLENSALVDTGPLTGLSVLGNSGRVAIANNHQLSLLDMGTPSQSVHACTSDSISTEAYFAHGLAVFSIGDAETGEGDWSFATPVNEGTQKRLLAYFPNEKSPDDSCKPSSALPGKIIAPLVGMDDPFEVMVISENPEFDPFDTQSEAPSAHVRIREYNNATSSWEETLASTGAFHISIVELINAVASYVSSPNISEASHGWHFWISAAWENELTSKSGTNLMRGKMKDATTAMIGGANESLSALALDAEGFAYAVVKPMDNDYELHRYEANAKTGDSHLSKAKLAQTPPVGSPILGQPIAGNAANAEVYVVTTDGTVYAFNIHTMALQWTQTLLNANEQPITIAATAQPVLNGNRLWVVSTDGELYSVVVNSDGLNKTAQWPTLHRDNCNSNSRHSTPSNLPSCF